MIISRDESQGITWRKEREPQYAEVNNQILRYLSMTSQSELVLESEYQRGEMLNQVQSDVRANKC